MTSEERQEKREMTPEQKEAYNLGKLNIRESARAGRRAAKLAAKEAKENE
jgi:hypothetical protein